MILFKRVFLIFFFFIFLQNKTFSSEITYKEILDNPIDLELNLNYAKQQEKAGNLKSTIATLERLNMLYPKNSDIKLYLLSILLKMDSKVKVDLMVKTMLNDPNTTDETKNLIVELLSDSDFKEEEKVKKWIAYLDLSYSQTEDDNISGRTKSGKIASSNKGVDTELPFSANDSLLTLQYDKTYVRGSSFTLGRILSDSSSMFANLGININTNNKKLKGESDVYSSSISYFKAYKNHYFSPYVYYNKPNFRRQEDYQVKGLGINNTYLFNDKFNLNYALSFSDTRYHSEASPINSQGTQTFKHAGLINNNKVYTASLRINYNLSEKTQLSSKLIFNDAHYAVDYNSYDSGGANIRLSTILPFGTLTLSGTHLTNVYSAKKVSVSSARDRKDKSLVTLISLQGDINKLLPFLRNYIKDNSTFYTLSIRESNVNSNIPTYEVKRGFKNFKITKRINFND